jgi:hypothetical protein
MNDKCSLRNPYFFHLLTLILIFPILSINAQNTRLKDNNSIGWYTYTGTFKLNSRLSLHTEYQWRRDDYINNWQQSLIRTGINYTFNPKLTVRLGYANIATYDYGDVHINSLGKNFTEHRAYEMATLTDKMNSVEFSHRFMLEQRWIGRYSNAALSKEDDWLFLNRFRYMLRMQVPLKGNKIANNTPYVAVYDEIAIGFGKNVNENIFDQNRLGILLGYRFSPAFRIEGGFLSQILQLGREINGSNLFQYNNGIILNTVFNFDLSRKK